MVKFVPVASKPKSEHYSAVVHHAISSTMASRPAGTLRLHLLALPSSVLAAAIASASALAAGDESEERLPQSRVGRRAGDRIGHLEGLPELTEPLAAKNVPLENLQRDEALELLDGVFATPVEEAAGIYDELQQAKLLSPRVAVLPKADSMCRRRSTVGSGTVGPG